MPVSVTGRYHLSDPRRVGRWPFSNTVWEFTNDADDPLTIHCRGGWLLRPDRHFLTDGGSIPRILRWVYDAWCFVRAFLFHDSGYESRGVWVAHELAREQWAFRHMTRQALDLLLRRLVPLDGGSLWDARIIYRAVRMFGWLAWARRARDSADKRRKALA